MAENFKITFVLPDGTKKEVEAPVGHTIMEIAKNNDIEQIEALVHWHMDVHRRPWEPPDFYVHRIFDHILGGTLDR